MSVDVPSQEKRLEVEWIFFFLLCTAFGNVFGPLVLGSEWFSDFFCGDCLWQTSAYLRRKEWKKPNKIILPTTVVGGNKQAQRFILFPLSIQITCIVCQLYSGHVSASLAALCTLWMFLYSYYIKEMGNCFIIQFAGSANLHKKWLNVLRKASIYHVKLLIFLFTKEDFFFTLYETKFLLRLIKMFRANCAPSAFNTWFHLLPCKRQHLLGCLARTARLSQNKAQLLWQQTSGKVLIFNLFIYLFYCSFK